MKYLLIGYLMFLSSCSKDADCTHKMMVTKLGGCDRTGWCAVEVQGGQTTQAHYPVVGHEAQVCMCNGKLQPPDRYFIMDCE